jgi:predicted amidohydrolase
MKVLLASINCQKAEIELNLATHKQVIRQAVAASCDLVVFPEMSLTGYLAPAVHSEYFVDVDSRPVVELIEYGNEHSIDLLFGIVERSSESKPFITHIHASAGQVSGIYRKRNLADNESAFRVGSNAYQGEIGDQSFGVAVCADYEVADEFVAAAGSGATIVFHPSAPGLYGERKTDDAMWQSGFDWWRTSCIERHGKRAKELGISIAVCSQAGSTFDEDFPGWSALFGSDGEIVAELPDWRTGSLIVEI